MVIYIRNDNVRKRMAVLQNGKGKKRLCTGGEAKWESGERVNPVTLSGEHSGVVRGLYKNPEYE